MSTAGHNARGGRRWASERERNDGLAKRWRMPCGGSGARSRPRNKPPARLMRRIAANWDWGLCQPLYVARRADGKLYVVDGQHRWAAAKLRGDVWQLPCVVRSFESTEHEAAAFVALNQERTPLTVLQIFRA